MTTPEQGIYSLLSTGTPTNTVGARIYPVVAEQGAQMPYIVYQRITTEAVQQVNGPLGEARATIQINAYGENYSELRTVSNDVRATLHGYAGTPSTNSVKIQRIYWENESDDHEPPESGGQVGVFEVRQDFAVWYQT